MSNRSRGRTLNLGNKAISPGRIVELSPEEMANAAVDRWLKQGVLARVRLGQMMKRLAIRRPRILVVVHTLFRGGAEISTMELHRAFKMHKVTQAILNIYVGDEKFHNMLADEAKEIFDIFEAHRSADPGAVEEIVREFAGEFNPHIIMYSLLRSVPEAFKGVPDRPPIVQVMHSELGDSVWGYDSDATDAVITVSRTMARNRHLDLNIPDNKLFPIWNGIDPSKFLRATSLRDDLGIPFGAVVVGMIGNMNSLKRPDIALESFGRVRQDNDYIIFAGNPAELAAQVETRAKELGIVEYVKILGLREDIENVYKTIDFMVNCSTMEGLPMTIIEAMFSSVPVIATGVGGNPEVVIHGRTGFIYPSHGFDDLDGYMTKMLRDGSLRERMAEAAFRRAQRYFRIETTAENYMDVLKRFIIFPEQLRLSVVMPVYNSGHSLDRAIWSVRRQTMPYFEFIIVDDGSTDRSQHIMEWHAERDERIRIVKIKHSGIVPALNAGIKLSRTPLIARMDADDEMLPNRLERQAQHLDSNPDLDVLGCQMLSRLSDGSDTGQAARMPLTHEDIQAAMHSMNPLCHPTVVFRKAMWEKVGGYKGDGRCEDLRLWTDIMVAGGRFENLSDDLLIYTHTHDGDPKYAAWRDSILVEIHGSYAERMGALKNG